MGGEGLFLLETCSFSFHRETIFFKENFSLLHCISYRESHTFTDQIASSSNCGGHGDDKRALRERRQLRRMTTRDEPCVDPRGAEGGVGGITGPREKDPATVKLTDGDRSLPPPPPPSDSIASRNASGSIGRSDDSSCLEPPRDIRR